MAVGMELWLVGYWMDLAQEHSTDFSHVQGMNCNDFDPLTFHLMTLASFH